MSLEGNKKDREKTKALVSVVSIAVIWEVVKWTLFSDSPCCSDENGISLTQQQQQLSKLALCLTVWPRANEHLLGEENEA